MKSRVAAGVLIALLSVGGDVASGCSIVSTPVPLWDRMARSELIFLGRVVSLTRAAQPSGGDPSDSLDRDIAVIEVLESWKGDLSNEIRVSYSGNLYTDGNRVLAGDRVVIFAESGEAQIRRYREIRESWDPPAPDDDFFRELEASRAGRWFVGDDGAGIFAMGEEDARELRGLVEDAIRISEEGKDLADARRPLLVHAATLRPTRFVGVLGLRELLRTERTRAGQDPPVAADGHLTEEERVTIATGFIRDPGVDASVPALLDLLKGYIDNDFDVTVVSVIEAALAQAHAPSWLPEAIRAIVTRSGWHDGGWEVWERHRSEGTLGQVWPAVATDLGLPAGDPSRIHVPPGEREPID